MGGGGQKVLPVTLNQSAAAENIFIQLKSAPGSSSVPL